MPFATVNSLQLHYELEGQGHPVVLIHPVDLDLTYWTAQMAVLAPEIRVLRVNLRGTAALPFHRRHTRWEDLPPTCTPGGAMEG